MRMADVDPIPPTGGGPARFSYLFMVGTLILLGCFRLATPLLVAIFVHVSFLRALGPLGTAQHP